MEENNVKGESGVTEGLGFVYYRQKKEYEMG